jgi:uncharacterized phiE125 gp8 family phage protein
MSSSDNSTLQNYQLYELVGKGTQPVSLAEIKTYLGVTNTASDALLQSLLDACTAWGQSYTGREFSDNDYILHIDCFEDRISLRKNPIDSITTVKYSVAFSLVTIASTVYYLKNGVQLSEILLKPDQIWPTDGDEIEQGIQIAFKTKAVDDLKLDMAKTAIKRHTAYMFENRGDCGDCGSCAGKDAAGVTSIYDYMRIPRV